MKNLTILALILGAAFSRWIPHPVNVTAVTALALLGGAYVPNRALAVILPVVALWLSDLVLGFHSTMLFVYAATALIALAATFSLKSSLSPGRLAIGSVSASLFFFVVTNFGVWMMDSLYPKTAAGLAECYVMALEFLGNQVVGDLLFAAGLFAVIQALKAWKPALVKS
jgi:hypothetical protein